MIEAAVFVGETIGGFYTLMSGIPIEIGPVAITMAVLLFWIPMCFRMILTLWHRVMNGSSAEPDPDEYLTDHEQTAWRQMQVHQRRQRLAKWQTQQGADKVKVIYK